jgi:hypothetical protein
VLHLPWQEKLDFNLFIGTRYLRQLVTRWPKALLYAATHRGTSGVSDAEFVELMTGSVYSRFLNPFLCEGSVGEDVEDKIAFRSFLAEATPETVFFKSDLTPMRFVRTFPGMYVAATCTLWRQNHEGARLEPVAIRVADEVITPDDAHGWELAKLFVLQGAAYGTLFIVHPALHFPFDSINAITKSAVPEDHVLFQVMEPHLRFSLPLNHGVLEGRASVVSDGARWNIYAPLTGDADEGLLMLFAAGFKGIEGNSSFRPYRYRLGPGSRYCDGKVFSDYGVFLDAYYAPIHRFVEAALEPRIERGDPFVTRWAHHIAEWIPGFPGEHQIFEPGVLSAAVAAFIWDVSVLHSTDHQTFGHDVDVSRKFLRLRVPPPVRGATPPFDPDALWRFHDTFKADLASEMFFKPTTVTRLANTRYRFDDPELVALNNELLRDLWETERKMPVRRFMPLAEMAQSIQY